MEAKAEGRCVRCKNFLRAMLKNREGHHSDDAVKKGIWIALSKTSVVHRCVVRCSVVVH